MRAWKSLEALSVAQVALLALSGAALAADVIAMPGEFAIQTVHPGIYNGFYLTAVDGGGPTNGRFMAATGGGGRIKSVISYPGPNSPREWGGFTLLRQDDGLCSSDCQWELSYRGRRRWTRERHPRVRQSSYRCDLDSSMGNVSAYRSG
jgi:hypothetical protein